MLFAWKVTPEISHLIKTCVQAEPFLMLKQYEIAW